MADGMGVSSSDTENAGGKVCADLGNWQQIGVRDG